MTKRREKLQTFLGELKRRRVYRVTIAYGVAAFVIAQGAELVLPAIGLDTAVSLIIVLLLLGLPVAVVLAWAFDLTPQGLQRTPPLEAIAAQQLPATDAAAAPEWHAPRDLPFGSIAALPFSNLSNDSAHEYFGDGLTEELLGMLSRVPDLHVAARSSCFALKNTSLDAQQAGRRLGVRHIVEGSVRIAGDRIRLTVHLVDTRTGYTVWTEQFDRKMTDVIALQQEVAHAIVARVAAAAFAPVGRGMPEPAAAATQRVTTDAATPAQPYLERRTTDQVEALKLYMQGRYCCNRRTEADLQRAIRFFDHALDIDPDYALAYAGLADTYAILLDYGFMPTADALERASASAERALELDPASAEIHTSLALVRQFEWRWADAEAAFEKSIRLDPDYAVAHQRYALHLAWMKHHVKALEHARRAERLDPLTPATSATVGWVLYYARRYPEAIVQLEQVLAREPQFAPARIALGRALMMTGATEPAIAQHEQALQDSARSAANLALLAYALARAGRSTDARALMTELEAAALSGYVSRYYRALPFLGLGETPAALDHLEAAVRERAAQLLYTATEPIMDPLRDEPRFHAVQRALGFPEL